MTDEIFYKSPDGLSLYARCYGPLDAPLTALCMHGLTRNHKDFEPMIEALGGRYRFIAVDQRGREILRGRWLADPGEIGVRGERLRRGVDVARVSPRSQRIADELGWKARVDLATGLRRTWSWHQQTKGSG